MTFCQWPDAPADVREQAERYVAALRQAIGANLVGIYLHGSWAMGCFNPAHSDIDLLVVVRRGMAPALKRAMLTLLLACSGRPSPMEVSFLTMDGLQPWRHPAPYDLHWSEGHRCEMQRRLDQPGWESWLMRDLRDRDLAAHVTMLKARGVALLGAPIPAVFADVDPADYLDALWYDVEGAPERIAAEPLYLTLNLARVLGYLEDGLLLSKEEGAVWALAKLPPRFTGLLQQALACYGGAEPEGRFDSHLLTTYATYMDGLIRRALAARGDRPT